MAITHQQLQQLAVQIARERAEALAAYHGAHGRLQLVEDLLKTSAEQEPTTAAPPADQ